METREIPGFTRYKATSEGYILSTRGAKMSSWISASGRPSVYAVDDYGVKRQKQVDRLVALAFLEGDPGQDLLHLDNDLLNCRSDNLEYSGMALSELPADARPIEAAPGYLVTPNGTVISTLRRAGHQGGFRVFSPWVNSNGYLCVSLRKEDGKLQTHRVHVLVATTFHGPKPFAEAVVRHLNGDKLDNLWTNLQWGTTIENSEDAFQHGRFQQGEASPLAKLTDASVLNIRSRQSESRASLAREFGVSPRTIMKIQEGRSWRHLL